MAAPEIERYTDRSGQDTMHDLAGLAAAYLICAINTRQSSKLSLQDYNDVADDVLRDTYGATADIDKLLTQKQRLVDFLTIATSMPPSSF